jgi:hypothetical protein
MAKHIKLHRYNVQQNPKTGKTIVHLHGTQRGFFSSSKQYENFHLPYIQKEKPGHAVRRAIKASANHWSVPILFRLSQGI